MKINNELCNKCGRCVMECCHLAIIPDDNGGFFIDQQLCNNCEDLFDIECIRVCKKYAIIDNEGKVPEIDRTLRLRSEHLPWLIAVMGSRDNGDFPLGLREWEPFRKIISDAYLNPEKKVRFTKCFDDNCIGCPAKVAPGHAAYLEKLDDLCFKQLGIEPGTVMGIWDAIRLGAKKFPRSFFKEIDIIKESIVNDFFRCLPPDEYGSYDSDDKNNELLFGGLTACENVVPEEENMTIEINGCRVSVSANVDLELLARVCQALK